MQMHNIPTYKIYCMYIGGIAQSPVTAPSSLSSLAQSLSSSGVIYIIYIFIATAIAHFILLMVSNIICKMKYKHIIIQIYYIDRCITHCISAIIMLVALLRHGVYLVALRLYLSVCTSTTYAYIVGIPPLYRYIYSIIVYNILQLPNHAF